MNFIKTFFLSLFIILNGCDDQPRQKDANEIIVGTSADLPPFEYYQTDSDGAHLKGFDIELAILLGEQLGKKVVIKDLDFSVLIPSLQSGQIDMIIATMSPTPERRTTVDFSQNYLSMPTTVLSRGDLNIQDQTDLSHKKIGVQLGSSFEIIARSIHKKDHTVIIETRNKFGDLIQELLSGRLDAVILESTAAAQFVRFNPQLKYVVLNQSTVDCAIALPKNSSLKEQINQALTVLINKGVIQDLKSKWLKSV